MSVRQVKCRNSKTRKETRKWMVDVDIHLPNGSRERVRKISPIQTRRSAEEYERKLRESILNGQWQQEEAKKFTFAEFSQEFIDQHAQLLNKPSEICSKKSMLKNHLIPFFGSIELSGIDDKMVDRFKVRQKGLGLKNKTINNQLILLNSILNKALKRKLLKEVLKIEKLPVTTPKIRFLDFDEKHRLMHSAEQEPEWFSAIAIALNTGLRLGELLGLQWDDIDFKAKRLVVTRSIWQGHIGSPKSNKARVIFLNDSSIKALRQQRHLRGPWVWCHADGRPYNKDDFQSALRRIRKRGGLQHFEWHCLRHTFASHLIMSNASPKAVQELLGHASLQTTMRYAHLTPNYGREVVENLDRQFDSQRQNSGNVKKENLSVIY